MPTSMTGVGMPSPIWEEDAFSGPSAADNAKTFEENLARPPARRVLAPEQRPAPVAKPLYGDFDLSQKGFGEANIPGYINQAQGIMDQGPGQAFDVATAGMSNLGGEANQAQQAFMMGQQTAPANMAKYYQQAGEQAIQGIDKQAAARGMYGSSAALELGQQALTDLAGQRAMQEAQYGINRGALMGQLGAGAAGSQMDAFQGGAGIALEHQGMDLATLQQMGYSAAQIQALKGDRVGQVFDSSLGLGGQVASTVGDSNRGTFAGDETAVANAVAADLASTEQGVRTESQQTTTVEDIGTGLGAAGKGVDVVVSAKDAFED